MERTKRILNISIAISIVLCSLSIFIYSLKNNTANAQPVVPADVYKAIDVLYSTSSAGYEDIIVIGYNEQTKNIKILATLPRIP
ncbi:MAG: hypothetical protein NTX93_00275 [Bacteroidia bacterium]|nr:hypothetical protein [Bacteroidia bacterium]